MPKMSRKQQVLNMSDTKLDASVKIQGTIYDRKRKVTPEMSTKMSKMLNSGKSLTAVASHFGVDRSTVKYNTDATYRDWVKATKSGLHTGVDTCTKANRVAYKRALVAAGKRVGYDL